MNTYYDLLGVAVDADAVTISQAYNSRIASLYEDLVNGKISNEDYNRLYSACTSAKDILTNPALRQQYDQKVGITVDPAEVFRRAMQQTGAQVTQPTGPRTQPQVEYGDDDDEYDYGDEEEPRKRGRLKIALITGACIAAIAACAWLGPKVINSLTPNTHGQNIVGVVTPSEEDAPQEEEQALDGKESPDITIEGSGKDVSGGDVESQEEQEPEQQQGQTQTGAAEVKNYGDITNISLVEERATKLLEEFNKAGMINLTTSIPYTKEELTTLILYVNGEYTPETEEEAFDLYTEFLNLVCAPVNIDDTLIQSAYLGGEDSFKSTVEGFINNQHRPDIVTAFTFGDNYAAPYLYWLQEQFYNMRYTTDRAEATRIWNEVFQSYADVMKGDGFTLNGVTYTEKNILGLDKVGISNLYLLFGLDAEVFRTTATKDNFEVTNHLISADPEMQKDVASFDEVSAWLNGACGSELIAVDDQGLPLITTDEEGRSLGELSQINTIFRAKENFLAKNTKTLSK